MKKNQSLKAAGALPAIFAAVYIGAQPDLYAEQPDADFPETGFAVDVASAATAAPASSLGVMSHQDLTLGSYLYSFPKDQDKTGDFSESYPRITAGRFTESLK